MNNKQIDMTAFIGVEAGKGYDEDAKRLDMPIIELGSV